jgi:sugar lactone lactonase YvrE
MHWRLEMASRWIAGGPVTAILLACGSSNHSPAGPSTGSLAVTITAPSSIKPSVIVTGPNNYRQLLRASETLTGLSTGTYVVTASKVATVAPIVSVLYFGMIGGNPANVSANDTATATVAYTPASGSGYLWATTAINSVNTLVAFDTAALDVSGTPTPAITIQAINGSLNQPTHTAFDTSGTLWVTNFDTLVGYTSTQIATSGAPVPTITIGPADSSLDGPFTLAFDATGYLWVVNLIGRNVVAYSPQQLSSSGAPTPAMTLSSTDTLKNPEGIAFDARGNLWVTSAPAITGDSAAASSLQSFTPIQLSKGGAQTPTVTLTGPGLEYASAIAFDVSGNLWLTNDRDTIAMYTAGQLATGGAQTPKVIITGAALSGPDGLAFDNSGDLWVANGTGSLSESIVEYSASQLATGGTPTPVTTLTTNGTSILGTVGLTFYPHAPGLPMSY